MLAKLKTPFILIISLILLATFGYAFLIHQAAPDVTFTTIQGKKISMASLQGKVVLVSFWATDCRSCIKEMPELINTYQKYKAKGFEVIAVAMPYDPPAQVLNFVTQKKLPFVVMHDGLSEITQSFGGINATPTAYLFNKQGKRLQRTVGILDFVKLRATLDKELG